MEIEGYDGIINTIILAKELHDTGRFDVVQSSFFDALSWDSTFENQIGTISSLFGGYYSNYDDYNDYELMIFTDDYISRYFEIAHEYGRSHNVCHDENPFVIDAKNEIRRWLTFCNSMDYKLLGYTKTRRTARQSKLIVYVAPCECDSYGSLARGLIEVYRFFRDKCEEFGNQMVAITENMNRTELMAA